MSAPGAGGLAALARERLAEIAELEAQEIPLDAELVAELGIDSLQQLELITELERELGVRLTSEQWREAQTLRQLAELLGAAASHP